MTFTRDTSRLCAGYIADMLVQFATAMPMSSVIVTDQRTRTIHDGIALSGIHAGAPEIASEQISPLCHARTTEAGRD